MHFYQKYITLYFYISNAFLPIIDFYILYFVSRTITSVFFYFLFNLSLYDDKSTVWLLSWSVETDLLMNTGPWSKLSTRGWIRRGAVLLAATNIVYQRSAISLRPRLLFLKLFFLFYFQNNHAGMWLKAACLFWIAVFRWFLKEMKPLQEVSYQRCVPFEGLSSFPL